MFVQICFVLIYAYLVKRSALLATLAFCVCARTAVIVCTLNMLVPPADVDAWSSTRKHDDDDDDGGDKIPGAFEMQEDAEGGGVGGRWC